MGYTAGIIHSIPTGNNILSMEWNVSQNRIMVFIYYWEKWSLTS